MGAADALLILHEFDAGDVDVEGVHEIDVAANQLIVPRGAYKTGARPVGSYLAGQ